MKIDSLEKKRRAFLAERTARFYNRYGPELASVCKLLQVKLEQIALAYTLENDLPRESIEIRSRVKSKSSFLEKLADKGWPDFYYPTEVATDLVGARIICWFLDDCDGFLDRMKGSKQIQIRRKTIEDYIRHPKVTGYRSIHVLADISYDRVKLIANQRRIVEDRLVCEIQLRSKLQDAWAEFTHEVHYKVADRFESDFEVIVAEIANRLASEDRNALAVRNLLQRETGKKHEGLTS